ESMEHILTQCDALPRKLVWDLAKRTWPDRHYEWPQISSGIILGCGTITEPKLTQQDAPHHARWKPPQKAMSRLLQILLTEAAHLIWVLRCERVIHEKQHTKEEIEKRWIRNINERLTTDKIAATKIKRDKTYTKLIKDTWEQVLRKEGDIPSDWMSNNEVLVGRRPFSMF
ncbi:hypothetical protein BC826DRAFT_927494, partial [Russula brevipes]